MSNGLNKVLLFGNIGQDPELRHTNSGTAVLNIRMATNERRKVNGEWTDHAEWHSVTVWDKRAEGLSKFLTKGHQILVEGRLQTRQWEDKDGNKRYTTEVVAYDVIVTSGGDRQQERREPEPRPDPPPKTRGGFDDDDSIPF